MVEAPLLNRRVPVLWGNKYTDAWHAEMRDAMLKAVREMEEAGPIGDLRDLALVSKNDVTAVYRFVNKVAELDYNI